jgi:hypothetical protein
VARRTGPQDDGAYGWGKTKCYQTVKDHELVPPAERHIIATSTSLRHLGRLATSSIEAPGSVGPDVKMLA